MIYALLADIVVLLHLFFVLFVVLGGLLIVRYGWIAWLHLPTVAWGAVVELAGWVCPLTPLENHLRLLAGKAGYQTGFIDHYLIPLIYPAGLTRSLQIGLGLLVVALNLCLYILVWYGRVPR